MRTLFDFDLTKYDKFLYGFLGGVVLGVLISAFQFLTFLVAANLFVSVVTWVMIFRTFKSPKRRQETRHGTRFRDLIKKPKGCPECGSTRRHKKTCSRSKSKK